MGEVDPLLRKGKSGKAAVGAPPGIHYDEENPKTKTWQLPVGGGKKPKPSALGDTGASPASYDSIRTLYESIRPHGPTEIGDKSGKATGPQRYLYYVIYALVNVIISAPGLYGYAAVIFNHPVYSSHMNALSKIVIFSSFIHQLGFLLFSSLPFSIGTVQDAGLIFLSSMANKIANEMLDAGHSHDEILTTTLVLLSCGTALLGVCLIAVGHFKLADAVSYLPMPVVGGYLAYIGYFCCQAGVALCISTPLITLSDWAKLLNFHNILLAIPGLGAGLILTLASRKINSDAGLPLIMVAIPVGFYLILWVTGQSLETAREAGWVGEVAPPVPVSDLFRLVDFSLVHWSLWTKIVPTWCGMVFVVSFASCLDVAAISIDMGEALDTNRELTTVGICNLMSGLTLGYTGSYIFSQTIFTYRTGVHSRWIGGLIMVVFLYIVVSEVNVLEIAPLFFLGSTLIFIGYDLLFEWLWEIRHQVFITEYLIVILTFLAIQLVGIDAGIVVGVIFAVIDHVILTATTSTITKIHKRSRAIWTPEENRILHNYGYNVVNPKIVTLHMTGTVFFGSALQCLNRIIEETHLKDDAPAVTDVVKSPRTPHAPSLMSMRRRNSEGRETLMKGGAPPIQRPPKYLVLDLMLVTHLDASATRGCFLQLVKLCAKQGIIVCASGVTPRIEWMFRTHGVGYKNSEEAAKMKADLQSRSNGKRAPPCEQALLFVSDQDALEFCENALLHQYREQRNISVIPELLGPQQQSLQSVLAKILKATDDEKSILERLEEERYHEEMELRSGEVIFPLNVHSDAFYVVLSGSVANNSGSARTVKRLSAAVFSGAGKVGSQSGLMDAVFLESTGGKDERNVVAMTWSSGSVVGYLDFLLDRPRLFRLIAIKDGTRVAKFSLSHMNLLKADDPELYYLVQRVLLHAATADVANCTCHYE